MGAFTHTDQKCVDVAYLRDPAMAEHCGLRNAAGWYSDALDGAAAPSEAWAAREGACAEPEGAWDTLGTCGYADRLGELLDGTKCVTATARWGANALPAVFPFWNYSKWRSFIDFTFPGEFPRVGFNVSYANGTWLPGCEFLGTRRIHGRGSAYDVTHGLGSKHTELSTPVEMHCNYYPETRSWGQRPFIMGSTFTCEEAITVAAATNNTADLSHHQGLADVVQVGSCDDANCILCIESFNNCRAASIVEASKHMHESGISAVMHNPRYIAKLYAVVGSSTITVLNSIISVVGSVFTEYSLPMSHSHRQKRLMLVTLSMMLGNTFLSFIVNNWAALGNLGFYLTGGLQIFTLVISYSVTKSATLIMLPIAKMAMGQLYAAPRAPTQRKMNVKLQGPDFDFAKAASQVVFLVFIGITFSTALPLALPLTALATGLLAFIERLYLLRVYKQPPRYSADLIESAVMLLRLSILAKVLSMLFFYRTSRGGEMGPKVLVAVAIFWYIPIPTPKERIRRVLAFFFGRVFPSLLKKPPKEYDDVATTTTYNSCRRRGMVTPYLPASFLSGPLGGPEALERKWMPAPNRPKPAKTYLEQFDAVVAEVSDVEGGAAVAFGASPREIVEKWGKLRECRVWTNPKAATNQLPKITMSPDSFEQTLVSDDDYVTEYPKVVPMEIVTMDEGKAEKAFVKYRKAELKKQNKAGLDVAQEILEITADVRCCAKDALDAELHKEWVEWPPTKREWRLGLLYETDDEDDVDDDRKRYKITDILPHGPAADAGLSVGNHSFDGCEVEPLYGRRRRRAAAVD